MFQTQVCCRYDGTFAGFLCCVFDCYVGREEPVEFLTLEDGRLSLYPERTVPTRREDALRVYRSLAVKLGPVGQRLAARGFLQETCPGRYEAIFSNPCYLEITRRGCNKGGMVARLAGLLDIAPEHIYCVGDNQNDIPMLAISAIPFAPSNCAPEVRAWGPRIVGSCDESCIAQIIGILDGIYT